MRPRTSINTLAPELITKIADYSTQQSCENLSLVNKDLFSKLGGTFFSNANEMSIGNYLADRQNEMDEIYEKIISAAIQGCTGYLSGYILYFEDNDTNGNVRVSKGTNRAFWFLNIFKECSVNFSLLALFSLLSEENGKFLKKWVLSSIKNQLIEHGLSEKQIPNIKRYLLNKLCRKEADLYNAKQTLIESIHNQQHGGRVYRFGDHNEYIKTTAVNYNGLSNFKYFAANGRYDYVIKEVKKLERDLMQNNFITSNKTCLMM